MNYVSPVAAKEGQCLGLGDDLFDIDTDLSEVEP
jgi:hypothetical protein